MRQSRFFTYLRQRAATQLPFTKRSALTLGLGTGLLVFCGHTAYAADLTGKRLVFSWGSGQYGQIGYGGERDVLGPLLLSELVDKNVVFLSAGGQQSAAVTEDGKLFTWGRSQDKRLGHGDSEGNNESYPRLVEELLGEKVTFVDAGFLHMACVTEKGDVWTWGKNSTKQLGHKKSDFPMKVDMPDGAKVTQVACGRNHTLALTEEGQVYGWGGKKDGAHGTGKRGTEPKPTLVHTLADNRVVQIAAGEDFSLFLTEDGAVWSCGASDFGQTGQGRGNRYITNPTNIHSLTLMKTKIVRVACGQYHAVCVAEDGAVYTWGFNKDGGLGQGDNFHRHAPSRVPFAEDAGKATNCNAGGGHTAVVFNDGETAYLFGRGRSGQIGRAGEMESVAAYRANPVEVNYFKNNGYRIRQVVCGSDHTALITEPASASVTV